MKKIIRFAKKQPFLLWILIALITLTSIISYAAYDDFNSVMKRVIVASEGKRTDFTSNYLVKGNEGVYTHKTLYRSESQDSHYETDLVIRNYDPDADYPYEMNIEYDLLATITDSSGTPITDFSRFFSNENSPANKTVIIRNDSGVALCTFTLTSATSGIQTYTISEQVIDFIKGKPGELKYKLEFSNWSLESDSDLCIMLVTKLDRGTGETRYSDLEDIGAVLGLNKNQESVQNGWRASISEIEQAVTGAVGYNLVLTGSGKSDITIKWDTDKVSVNELFRGTESVFDLHSGEVVFTEAPSKLDSQNTDTWATIVIHADANLDRSGEAKLGEYRNYYNIQVYSTGEQLLSGDFFEVLENGAAHSGSSLITVSIVKPSVSP